MNPEFLVSYKELIDLSFKTYLEKKSHHLEKDFLKATSYVLNNEFSKRLRGALVLGLTEALGDQKDQALNFSLSIESLHAYSLVHDDLPCMDDASIRRNKKCLHLESSESTAVLIGDYLLSLSFEFISSYEKNLQNELRHILVLANEKMLQGQFLDLKGTKHFDELEKIYFLKTGALFEACFKAVESLSQKKDLFSHLDFPLQFGLFFQFIDDYLGKKDETSLSALHCMSQKELEGLILEKSEFLKKQLKKIELKTDFLEKMIEFNLNRIYGKANEIR